MMFDVYCRDWTLCGCGSRGGSPVRAVPLRWQGWLLEGKVDVTEAVGKRLETGLRVVLGLSPATSHLRDMVT